MSEKVVCQNRKARHEYFIEETFEAGMVLEGPEVKSLRDGRANLVDSYGKVRGGELFLFNMHISPYPFAHHVDLDPKRTRKLLLTKKEIKRIIGKTEEKGYTMIPLKVFFSGGWAKLLIGLARGKKKADKRQAIKEKDMKRDMDRERKRSRY
ncbi:MAG: SsrA-binding protein SmpB [Desulfatiglandales bacterium]